MSQVKYVSKIVFILLSVINCGLRSVHGQFINYHWCTPRSKDAFMDCLNSVGNVVVQASAYQDNKKVGIDYSITDAGNFAVNQNPLKKLVMINYMERGESITHEMKKVFNVSGAVEILSCLLETYRLSNLDPMPITYWNVSNYYQKVITFLRDTAGGGSLRIYNDYHFELFYNSSLEVVAPNKGIVLDAALASKATIENYEKYLINFNVVVFASRNMYTTVYYQGLGDSILAVHKFAKVILLLWDRVYDKLKPYIILPTTSTITTTMASTTETNSTSETTETATITETDDIETKETDDYDREVGSSNQIRIPFKLLAILVFATICTI